MNTKFRVGALLVVSVGSVSAFADPMIVIDHNASVGPRHDALVQCVDAARRDPSIGDQLMFSTRMGVSEVKDGQQTFILKGTAWENGARVPVQARCVLGPHQSVASVTRLGATPAIAKAAQ
jgi:hypothetical protein